MSAAGGSGAGGGASQAPQGLPRSTVLVSAVAIVFAGLGTFALLQWNGARAGATEAQAAIDQATQRQAELHVEVDPLAAQYERLREQTDLLWTGKLKICNTSPEPIVVSLLAAVYLQDEGGLTTFNSADYGRDLWRLEPGEVRELSHPAAGWDGSVSYYAMWLKDATTGAELPYAGAWPVEAGYCVRPTGGES